MKTRRLAHFTLHLLCAASFAGLAHAEDFNIPRGDLKTALDNYATQTGTQFIYESSSLKGIQTQGVRGNLSADAALSRLLSGTGFTMRKDATGAVGITRSTQSAVDMPVMTLAQAAPARTAVETVTVTSSKLGGADVQSIPISITALSQEQLTATQTAGGPDLVKQVPNLTFSKTNFTGYNIQVRGIGTQAISVTTDPAVAVALNDIPFIRNHFFEQEFYDLSQAEVLRGPQGTLYGRNATAGVVNLVTAKPSDQFEAMASGEIGNYHQKRFEGMINLPIIDDRVDLRIAGEWTKRQGYSFNALDNQRIDGRDLWSGRATLALKPFERLQITAMWEHFSENDDRMRTAKQLCKTAPIPDTVNGISTAGGYGVAAYRAGHYLSQGCEMTSLYSADAFQVPNGKILPYYAALSAVDVPVNNDVEFDPYASTTQSRNLRVIETALNPIYKAKNDTIELNADYELTPEVTFTSQTGFNNDFLWSTEDYNRFNTRPGAFQANGKLGSTSPLDPNNGICTRVEGSCTAVYQPCTGAAVGDPFSSTPLCIGVGTFCDPQLGCSDRLVAQDLSTEKAWQLSQEFRFASHFSGPFNFSVGGNYLHYETEENYYVFINSLSLATYTWRHGGPFPTQNLPYVPGVSDNSNCLLGGLQDPNLGTNDKLQLEGDMECQYMDPNNLEHLNNQGHNYFLSQNPYTLNSYAAFGEVYYNIFNDVKLIAGLRWTEDQKHFTDIPSELLVGGYGYPITGVINQQWDQFTGRAAVNWTPKLDFTDQTLIYGSYAHGYKAGGANPPGATLVVYQNVNGQTSNPVHPLTFKPEFVDAFEIGSKNTLLDGALTLNVDMFYYNYENYQISRIVDRTSINDNFDAHVKGAEIESTWEPVAGLRFNFAGGWEDTSVAKGEKSIDLMDRADVANHPDWIVVKPWVTQASNCILPKYVVAEDLTITDGPGPGAVNSACGLAYGAHVDPATGAPFGVVSLPGYPGFDPNQPGINNGEGFSKDLSGNQLPNAPPFTVSFGAQYTIPLTSDWAGTLRTDYYWQDYSWARIFNDRPYDRLRGYTNVNLTLILTSQNGWQVMLYDKNVFNTTAITGDFLNSDDSGLTTNVFLTDPKLIGIRVTKNW
ncbi:MAG TPA: TonB-dependent receptor [Rhizomicrobium sp.]|nr:TonB-dependent receptor [Rhizomicrobium sp.]